MGNRSANSRSQHPVLFSAFLVLGIGGSVAAQADPLTLDLTASTRYSDNITKRNNNTREDMEHRIGLQAQKLSSEGVCQGALSSNLGFFTYQRNTFDNRVSGELDLNGYCQSVNWFRWNLRDTLRDRRTVATDPDTPENRERRNVLATGPTFFWALSPRVELFTDLEYQITRFERSTANDSDRYIASLGGQRQFSTRFNAGISVSHSEIDLFRRGEEITRDNLSLNFSHRGNNDRFTGRVGHTWLESEQGPFISDNTAITGELGYERRFEAGTRLELQVNRDLTDTSTDLDVQIPGLELDLRETSVVQVTSLSATLVQPIRPVSQVSFMVGYSESDFQRVDTREERYTGVMGLSHQFSDRLGGNVDLSYQRKDFDQGDGLLVHTVRPRLGLDYRQTRNFTWDAGVGLERRYETGGPGREYEEHFVSLGLTWNLR